ncbi:putative regulatory protein embR [Mycobacterium ulcerans str. Harvey]|uniref:Regulatory protein embR n=1 Tax=Mycobacterium ulcerans str. Harvey TaxID=1299332 RepID=A0ABN0QNB6_MYCUL|nr:putative regulatory protein embR [Mycobacterium ulcerans str. Harvey]
MSKLRRLMAGAGIETRELLANMPPGYRLTVADGDYDLGRSVTEKSAGVRAAAASGFEQASDHFSAALAQWRGPVLDDLRDFTFVDAFATGLAEEKLVTQIARAEVEIACGRAQSVIGELEGLTTDHPYREPLWVQLITAYYLAERQSDALDAYRRLRDRLADDLGVNPAPTVRALYGRILRQRPLDVCKTAQSNADETISTLSVHMPAIPDATHGPRYATRTNVGIRWSRPPPGSGAARTMTSFSPVARSAVTAPRSLTPGPASSSWICGH